MVSERPRSRRLFVASAIAIAAGCAGGSHTRDAAPAQAPTADDALLDDLERRTFDFFWSTADPTTGLQPDRAPTPSFSSIAAVGFGLTAHPQEAWPPVLQFLAPFIPGGQRDLLYLLSGAACGLR